MRHLSSVKTIYWDNNATTPSAAEVVDAMQPYWNEEFGNPASTHLMGRRAACAVKKAREQVARLVHCQPGELIFTSGATESNNLLFLGVLLTKKLKRNRVIVSAIEHKSVLEPARLLAEHGFDVVHLPVLTSGVVDLGTAAKLITDETLLVSVQAANNEIGTLQPIQEIAQIAHEHGAFFHTDAAQFLGRLPFDVQEIGCDFASFSSHKMYGPKGVGALYIRGGARRWPWSRPFGGGGQEMGLRPGTSNVPGIVGFGKASEIASQSMSRRKEILETLATLFVEKLQNIEPKIRLINKLDNSLPGTISIAIPEISSDVLIAHSKIVQLANGAACNSGSMGSSHVLKAIGCDSSIDESVIRVSLGESTSINDFKYFFDALQSVKHVL
jgi:cysteine desulfurase